MAEEDVYQKISEAIDIINAQLQEGTTMTEVGVTAGAGLALIKGICMGAKEQKS